MSANLLSLFGILGYVGPGAGLSMIGSLLGVGCVILLALLGPLLYSIHFIYSVIRRRRAAHATIQSSNLLDGKGMTRFM